MNLNTNTAKVVKENFIAGYGNLPAVHQVPVRNAIMNECGWNSRVTFHNKRKGLVRITPPEISILEAHFRKFGINPWTGLPFYDENY